MILPAPGDALNDLNPVDVSFVQWFKSFTHCGFDSPAACCVKSYSQTS
jgi:hypothetical protein